MKSSASPRILLTLALALSAIVAQVRAQDALILKDNSPRREGQIMGIADGKVKFKVGPAETGIPLDQVKSVVMLPPKAFDDILSVWQQGDAGKTLSLLLPFVQQYRGLPVSWAERASAL